MTTDALEAESAVCGSILLDARCLPEITEFLTEDDFILEANKSIFRDYPKFCVNLLCGVE